MHKSFRHETCKHILCRAIFHIDHSLFDMISDKLELNIDVFRRCMMCGILHQLRLSQQQHHDSICTFVRQPCSHSRRGRWHWKTSMLYATHGIYWDLKDNARERGFSLSMPKGECHITWGSQVSIKDFSSLLFNTVFRSHLKKEKKNTMNVGIF